MTIQIYHYAKGIYQPLKTLERQGVVTDEEQKKTKEKTYSMDRPGVYYEQVAFFLKPLDLEIMDHVFGPDHKIWHPGEEFIEHTVDINSLGEFKYEFIETPDKAALYYGNNVSRSEYHETAKKWNIEKKYTGSSLAELVEAYTALAPLVEQAFKDARKTPQWEKVRKKYAPTIPQLLVYPKSGEVEVKSIRKVVIL